MVSVFIEFYQEISVLMLKKGIHDALTETYIFD